MLIVINANNNAARATREPHAVRARADVRAEGRQSCTHSLAVEEPVLDEDPRPRVAEELRRVEQVGGGPRAGYRLGSAVPSGIGEPKSSFTAQN